VQPAVVDDEAAHRPLRVVNAEEQRPVRVPEHATVADLAAALRVEGRLVQHDEGIGGGVRAQLDVAARLVPIEVAATLFALIMAVTNLASSVSEGLGGYVYDSLGAGNFAFDVVVVLSTLFAASCWLLVPRLRREVPQWWA